MRDPAAVLSGMLAVEGLPPEFRQRLEGLSARCQGVPRPEYLDRFGDLLEAVSETVPEPPAEPWHIRLLAAWMGTTEAEVLDRFGGPLAPHRTKQPEA